MSWWDFGEGSGLTGKELQLYRVTCAFCYEKGNWSFEHRVEMKKPSGRKTLHFDTLKCGNCAGYIMVFWSTSSFGGRAGLHRFRTMPWAQRLEEHPEHWPAEVGRYWVQARRSLSDENWDAAAVMARAALQICLRDHSAQGRNLYEEINDLAQRGHLPPLMKEWSHEVRELGNDSAHPKPGQDPTEPQDARDIVRFMDFLFEYMYDLPNEIERYRARERA